MGVISLITWCTAVALTSHVQPPPGQVEDRAVSTSKPAASEPPDSGFVVEEREAPPTAEQLLKELRHKRPSSDPILPASVGTERSWPWPSPLLPEGTAVVKRSGFLAWKDPWWNFAFDPDEGQSTTRLLPNTNLEIMVRTSASSTAPVKFIVSGEMTVFEDENYLLVQLVTRAHQQLEQGDRESDSSVGTEERDRRDVPVPADIDTAEATARRTLGDASAEDVLSLIREQRPRQQTILTEDALLTPQPGSKSAAAASLMPEGALIVNRPGRLVWQGGWWAFALESDHMDHPEPPLRLLPDQSLELMVETGIHGRTGLVFLVSGEVTAFEGENYLLPRMAMRRIDTGNLRK